MFAQFLLLDMVGADVESLYLQLLDQHRHCPFQLQGPFEIDECLLSNWLVLVLVYHRVFEPRKRSFVKVPVELASLELDFIEDHRRRC